MMMMMTTIVVVVGLFYIKYLKFAWHGLATVACCDKLYDIRSLMKQSGWFAGW